MPGARVITSPGAAPLMALTSWEALATGTAAALKGEPTASRHRRRIDGRIKMRPS